MSRRSIKDVKSVLKYLITPLLFSVYPVIFLYTHNIEILVLGQLTAPLLFAILLAVLTFIVCKLILKQNIKASLAAVGFLILFWYYSLLFSGITYFFNLNHWHILPLLLFVYGNLVYLICVSYKRIDFENLQKVVFAVVSVLIIFNLFTLLPAEVEKYHITSQKEAHQEIGKKETDSKNYPDIYLIILDEYARFDTIKEEWGYDNDKFAEFLREKKFFVADQSEIRSPNTLKSIPTILNIEYLEGSTKESQKIRMFYHNYLFNYLSRNNYKIVFLDGLCADSEPSWDFDIIHIPLTTLKIDAIQKSKFDFLNDGFSYLVLNKTMLYSVLSLANNKDSANMWYQGNKYFFSYINNFPLTVNKTDEPAFLFAHIPCPHLPFVFDRDGNFLENPTNYWEHKSLDKKLIKSLYLEQYIYVTKRTINIVNEIFKISKKEPVILLMSDHGPRRISAGIDDAIQHRRVLNAVYFPDGDYTDLYDNIAPVNTLRVVLNKYFGEKFKMLEDR